MGMKLNSLTTLVSTVALATLASVSLSSSAQAQTFVGNSSGTWGTPDPGTNTNPVFSGVGTDTFEWGQASFGTPPNRLSFAGNAFSTNIDTLFQVGDLTYFNGSTSINTAVDSVPLNVELAFTDPTGFTESFAFNFDIVSTPNTNDPQESADFVFPMSSFGDRSFSFDGMDYTLELTGFSQDGGATTVDEFRVLEDATTTAAVFGKITKAPVQDVPEPTILGGLGLLSLYLIKRRRDQHEQG